jgi:hypothetical protein
VAVRAVTVIVCLWSLVRVALCAFGGLDFEGALALIIVVATVRSLKSWSRSS